MKIGLYGGSFNPITLGHLDVINNIISKKIVDQIWLMPCASNDKKKLVNGHHRIKMLELAIQNLKNENIKIFDFEVKNDLPNNTLNTIKLLKSESKYQGYDYYFIVGLDVANDMPNWDNHLELISLINFVILPRNGQIIKNDWFLKSSKHLYLNDTTTINISSTMFRETFNKNIVPSKVLEYIIKNKLYT